MYFFQAWLIEVTHSSHPNHEKIPMTKYWKKNLQERIMTNRSTMLGHEIWGNGNSKVGVFHFTYFENSFRIVTGLGFLYYIPLSLLKAGVDVVVGKMLSSSRFRPVWLPGDTRNQGADLL